MAKRKPTPATVQKPSRKGVPLHVWVEEAVREALERSRQKHRRALKDEVAVALEFYLQSVGLWPPSPE